jgi:pimeloyl-ACP methyl ester carboxylesterase
LIPAATGHGAGSRAVVLLHGIGGSGALWGPTLPALGAHRAIAWDMPGYDASPPLPRMTFPALAEALRALLDAGGIARADLVGHSMGGMVALEFARAHPARVRSLVLCATSAAFGGRDPGFREQFLAARLAPLDAGRSMAEIAPGVVGAMLGDAPDPAAAPAAIAAMSAVPEATYRAALECLTGFDRRADLPRIAAPTLLIAGERDVTAPVRGMERMQAAIPAARLVVIPGAGHLVPLERPAAFNQALTAFLATVPED